MKRFYFIAIMLISFIMVSCLEKGEVMQTLTGGEETLPDELKGLKVYRVGTGDGEIISVAVLNGQTVGTRYKSGKNDAYVAIVNDEVTQTQTQIFAKEIISENDSIIVLRK